MNHFPHPSAYRRFYPIALAVGLIASLCIVPGQLHASIASGTAVIDGSLSEWDISLSGPDFFAPMYTAGDNTKPVLSNLFLRYDSTTETLYGLVYRSVGGVNLSLEDAWFKEYSGAFGADNKLFDATSATISDPGAPDFAWVYSPSDSTLLVGYEASAIVPAAKYNEFEAHVNVGGDTSSTGRSNKSGTIMLDLSDIPPPTTTMTYPTPEPASLFTWGTLVAVSLGYRRKLSRS